MFKRVYRVLGLALAAALTAAILAALFVAPYARAYPTGWTLQNQIVGSGAAAVDVHALANHAWVTWRVAATNAIYVRHSADYGATWEPAVMLDDGTFANGDPVVVSESTVLGYVYVMFPGGRDGGGAFQIQLYQGTNFGASWTRTWYSTTPGNKLQLDAARGPDSGTIYWACTSDVLGTTEVFWGKIWNDGTLDVGDWLSCPPTGPSDGIASLDPAIAANGFQNAIVVWRDNPGGAYTREHILETHTSDGGASWAANRVIPDADNEVDYRLTWPQVAWDYNTISVVALCQTVADGAYHVSSFQAGTVGFAWFPVSVSLSICANTNAFGAYPVVSGRNPEDIFFRNASNRLEELFVANDILGPLTMAGGSHAISVASNDFASDAAVDYITAIASSGQIYMRRKDAVDPTADVTTPVFSGSDPVYRSGDFPVECQGAADDYAVDGTDMKTGIVYDEGIENVTYTCTAGGGIWNPLSCVPGNVVTSPPYAVTVNAASYNQAAIKIKTVALDSAGNTSEYITPGWIYVDLDKPQSSIQVAGTAGLNGYYRSNVNVTIACNELALDHSEYALQNLDTGQADSNWTVYGAPFPLTEGHWKVYYRSIDKANNVEDTKAGYVNVDTTPPTAFVTRPDKGVIQTGYYDDESFRLGGTGTDANGLSWGAIYIDGVEKYATTDSFSMAYVWNLANVAKERAYQVSVAVMDAAGNVGTSSKNTWVGNVARDCANE